MIPKLPSFVCAVVFAIAPMGLTGCNKSAVFSSSFLRSDSSVNGQRTITKKANGLTRKLETTTDVKMEKGRIVSFPKAAVVKLEESGSATPRMAELREDGASLALWVKENGAFRRGTAEEEAWVKVFLEDVIGD